MNDKKARIELRVTQPEKNKIARLAESCGLSQSEYVRQRTLGYAPRMVLPEVVDEIQQRLLLPEKSTMAQIRKEMMTWQQQASGPSKDG